MKNIHELSDEDKIAFVKKHAKEVEACHDNRFHTLMHLFAGFPTGRVLDYGCGWGHNAATLAQMGHSVVGIDQSFEEIALCKLAWGQEPSSLKFTNTEITDLQSASFDYVISNQVIEHVHNPGIYLSEINRVLSMGGKLIISLPNSTTIDSFVGMLFRGLESSLVKRSKQINEHYDKTNHHIHAWDPWHFTTLVSTVGFELEKYFPLEGCPIPTKIGMFKTSGYFNTKIKRLRNLSYTMMFQCKKVQEVRISPNE